MHTRQKERVSKRQSERIRLGVLTNPVAQHNHRFPFTHKSIQGHLDSYADAVLTVSRDEIKDAIRHLLFDRKINCLALNGGDGTIHAALNAIISLNIFEQGQLPPLLLLNGGTYNMASRAFGTKGDPVTTVRRFVRRYRDKNICDVHTRRMTLLDIRFEDGSKMVGMVFGSEVIANALDLCDKLGGGYPGLARLLFRGAGGCLLNTTFYKENLWRIVPSDYAVTVDGKRFDEVLGFVASTIDLKLVRGFVHSLKAVEGNNGFPCKIVFGKSGWDIVNMLPALLWDLPHRRIMNLVASDFAMLRGGFTVDGELYENRGGITISRFPYHVDVVSGDSF
jgi:hypothetical protein